MKNQITKGEWVVRGVDRVDATKRQIWFRAGGIHAGQDPYYIHYCRVNFDGTGLVMLTEGDGTHTIRYSPDGRFLHRHLFARGSAAGHRAAAREDGKLVCDLERGGHELARESRLAGAGAVRRQGTRRQDRHLRRHLSAEQFRPEQEVSGHRSTSTPGRTGSFVPQGVRAFHRPQEMAELGFIVVQIDGMGTSHRSKAFHDVCWKNLGDSGFPDRILWIKAAAAKYPSWT